MTPKERLLAVFEKKEPDVIPFAPDLTYYLDAAVALGKIKTNSDMVERIKLLIDFHINNHCIPYYIYEQGVFDFQYGGVEVVIKDQGQRQFTEYHVGKKVIFSVKEYSSIGYSWAPIKYAVETRQDLETLLEILSRTRCVPNNSRWVQVNDLFGDLGFPVCVAPRSPLPALMVDWAGVANTTFLMADEPDIFNRVLDGIDRMNDGPFNIICQSPVKLVHFADNLSGLTCAGLWDRYLAEYYARRVAQIHEKKKFCVSHLDGTLTGMIQRMARTGLDGIESITPSPVGDISLEKVNEELTGFDTILWGGIPGAMFCKPFTWDHIKSQVDVMLMLHKQGRRIIVSSADQVPPDGQIEFIHQIGGYLESLKTKRL